MDSPSKRLRLVGPDVRTPNPGRRWQVLDEHNVLVGWVTERWAVGFRARTLDDGWMSDDYRSTSEALSALERHLYG